MAYSALSAFIQIQWNYSVSGAAVSSSISFPAASAANTFNLKNSYTLGSGAGAVNGVVAGIQTITASSNVSIDLTSLTDVLGLSLNCARIKAVMFDLLSTSQDSTNGTNCASVTIGNGSNPNAMFLTNNTYTFNLNNGAIIGWADAGATGSVVNSTNKTIKILNGDGANSAAVLYAIDGATS